MSDNLLEILAPYGGKKGTLIPVLQKVQAALGYLPEEAISEISRFLGISKSEVYGVLTFYAQFRTTPTGKNLVRICRGTACHVRNGERILAEVERRLKIKPGETTPDLEYDLETVACLGCCALAPVIVINGDVHGQMTTTKVAELIPMEGEE